MLFKFRNGRDFVAERNLGEFEQLVLLAVLQLGEEAYSVPIVEEIERRTGREVTHAAVYVALRRLEDKDLVRSWMGEPTPERGGRSKRYFEVQPEAIPLLEASRDALLAMWDGLEAGTP